MTPAAVLDQVLGFCLIALSAAVVLCAVRLVRGPTMPDRVIALDLKAVQGVGLITVVAIQTGRAVLVDVALVFELVTFLATIAFARYIERSSRDG